MQFKWGILLHDINLIVHLEINSILWISSFVRSRHLHINLSRVGELSRTFSVFSVFNNIMSHKFSYRCVSKPVELNLSSRDKHFNIFLCGFTFFYVHRELCLRARL